jgi:predicted dehydrogenase
MQCRTSLSAKVFHIPFIHLTPTLKLHSILQRNPSGPDSAPAAHPEAAHFTSLEPFLADAALDLVVLSVPPNTHSALARAALEAGKHVLVEKPFVPSVADAEALVLLAREKGRLLCVYQNRRWDADFLTVRALLAAGRLGRVYELDTHFDRFRADRPATWKGKLGTAEGGGVLYDLGTHLLDQVYVLFGLPTSVSAKFANQREGRLVTGADPADELDSFTAVLAYADRGLLAVVRAGVMSVETPQPRFWVRGTKGSYHKTGLDVQEDQLRGGMEATDAAFGHEGADRAGRLCLVGDGGAIVEERCPSVAPETYRRFYELLGNALRSQREEDLPVPASQATDVLRIIEAIRESAKSGRDVNL